MPTHPNVNPEHYRLFSSMLDLVKMVGDQSSRVEGPGINIGHVACSHNGQMILVSGFRGYKVAY
ncbi:hypothetical protein TYRP_000605 [Tyrophagus putrescentiae]|nr:hypothetical protein TYRP_000605 [Tyrophagus putrescentiae]